MFVLSRVLFVSDCVSEVETGLPPVNPSIKFGVALYDAGPPEVSEISIKSAARSIEADPDILVNALIFFDIYSPPVQLVGFFPVTTLGSSTLVSLASVILVWPSSVMRSTSSLSEVTVPESSGVHRVGNLVILSPYITKLSKAGELISVL